MGKPTIYTIHQADAPQHVGRIQQIASRFEEQGRISKHVPLGAMSDLPKLQQEIQNGDVIIVLLTRDLEKNKNEIAQILSACKGKVQDLIVVEIIVDNIRYENEYITLPADLIPIRDRTDMDQAWDGIENNLQQLLPERKALPWKKFLIPALIAAAVILLIVFLPGMLGSKPEPAFSYRVLDFQTGQLHKNVTECYVPCVVSFFNDSKKFDEVRWDLKDTTITGETSFDFAFLSPGEKQVTLYASKGRSEASVSKTLTVKPRPFANFNAKNDGCVAPCEIQFENLSENAESYAWMFGDPNQVTSEKDPKRKYESPGTFYVTLTASNANKIQSDTTRAITILQDPSPFSQFTVQKLGARGQVPRTVRFNNLSRNAQKCTWIFGEGGNKTTGPETTFIEHVFTKPGTHTVVLTVEGNGPDDTSSQEFYIGPLERLNIHLTPSAVKAIENHKVKKGGLMIERAGAVNP